MKKILIFSYLPYPLKGGGQVAQFAMLEVLQYKMDVTFCAIIFNKETEIYIESLQKMLPKVKIITAFNGSIAKSKTRNLLRKTVSFTRIVISNIRSFVKSQKQKNTDDFLNSKTNTPFDYKSPAFIESVNRIIGKEKYDIIQAEFHPFIELILAFPANSKTVFIAHESRFLRLKSCYNESLLSKEYKNFILNRNELSEIAMMQKYSAVVTFSEFDKLQLQHSGLQNVCSIPFPIIASEFLPKKSYQKPIKIVFIGNEGHVPNKEGLLWYIKYCHGQCVTKYNLELTVIGNWPTRNEIKKMHKNIYFVGSVDSIDQYYEQSILIVPIFKGSGIRTKILYGMAKKVPMISTKFGCSGIDVIHNKHLLIAENSDEFILCIEKILVNEVEVEAMVNDAFDFVNTHYNQEIILRKRLELYNHLINTK